MCMVEISYYSDDEEHQHNHMVAILAHQGHSNSRDKVASDHTLPDNLNTVLPAAFKAPMLAAKSDCSLTAAGPWASRWLNKSERGGLSTNDA
jgi:hypothetical protein